MRDQKTLKNYWNVYFHFFRSTEELNSNICHQKLNNNNVDNLKEWKKRQLFASRWTGALRSVVFYPLHSAINISFFGAPPSFCINLYKIQLWLLNSLLQEKIVENLINEGPGVFIGFVEFRDLLSSDTRLKYKIRIIPIERREKDGNCICELNNKCGCVQASFFYFAFI
uniref:ILCR1 Ig-like domain-containing protein n=1 Tax=Meloidogyne incognita TaxID=6306 RepID=A0A914M9A2_MELIC